MLPVYDKPMIYYPLSALMLANVQEVLIISTPRDVPAFRQLLGSGDRLGMKFQYAVQTYPRGLADAFIIGEDFIGEENVALVLGDKSSRTRLWEKLGTSRFHVEGAAIFGYYVKDLALWSVEVDKNGKASLLKKNPKSQSHISVPGITFMIMKS